MDQVVKNVQIVECLEHVIGDQEEQVYVCVVLDLLVQIVKNVYQIDMEHFVNYVIVHLIQFVILVDLVQEFVNKLIVYLMRIAIINQKALFQVVFVRMVNVCVILDGTGQVVKNVLIVENSENAIQVQKEPVNVSVK